MQSVTFEIWHKAGKKPQKIDEVTIEIDWIPRPYPEHGQMDSMFTIGKKWCQDNAERYPGRCITKYYYDVSTRKITYSWADTCKYNGCPHCLSGQ
jgi:hypothetical protein